MTPSVLQRASRSASPRFGMSDASIACLTVALLALLAVRRRGALRGTALLMLVNVWRVARATARELR